MSTAVASRSTSYTLTLPRPHQGQQITKREAARFNALACGRRWGKTQFAIDLLTEAALPGWPVGYFAPTYKLLLETWRTLYEVWRPVITRMNATERRMELIGGGLAEFWSLEDRDAGRSRRYKRVFVDEAGLVADLLPIWHEAIRPTLSDYEGDAWLGGTPKGRNGFWHMYTWGQDSARVEWRSWQRSTHENPFIKPSEIEAMRQEMTDRSFRQEILAEFIEDGGGVFRGVRALASVEPGGTWQEGHTYIIGADWGKTDDYTVFTVVDATARAVVAMDRSNRVDYSLQRQRLRALADRWHPAVILAEVNSMGMPIVETLSREERMPVRPFVTTNASKAAIIDGLALAIERSEIALLNDPVLISELEAYEAHRLPSGLTRYAAPTGMHDDCVMSLAMAWSMIRRTNSAVGAFG